MSGLFTVLIAEKEHIDAIRQENKLFFEPFLESKELAFCYWNPEGQNLYDSVPGLIEVVGRRKDWRAVIVNNCNAEYLKRRNPFDVVDQSAIDLLIEPERQPNVDERLEKWEEQWKDYYDKLISEKQKMYKDALSYPLQKLATWLCFRPEDYILNEVKEKQDVYDWAMERINRENIKSGVVLEFLERNQYKNEQRLKELIRRDFVKESSLDISYPSEVHCISLRTPENSFFDPENYWTIHQESEYSTFADRNMYFDKMRFMVFDIFPKSHRDFRTDYIRFLAFVLIFVSNHVPGSAMQARRLYRIETETDDTPLCTLVTSYDRKLVATSEVIDNEIEKIRSEIPGELTDKAAEALFCTSKDVPVLLDESCDTEKVFAEKDYGLFFDSPENEFCKWNRDYRTSEKALTYIAKQYSRSIRKSIGQMYMSGEISEANISRLTPLQIDDVREYTEKAENEMVASVPSDLTDIAEYTERMSQESEKVKKTILQRMTKKTTIMLSLFCLGLYFVCFFPFLFANGSTVKTVMTSVLLSTTMIGLLAVVMIIALLFMRLSVINVVKEYNNTARAILNDLRLSMKRFSKYLTASCNVRRGYAVQNYANKNLDEYTKSLRIRKKHKEDIRKKRACLEEEYRDYFGDKSFCDETMSRPYDYDFDQQVEYTYPAPFLAGDSRQIEFISNGNFVTVPSSYITRILTKMEGIYEK